MYPSIDVSAIHAGARLLLELQDRLLEPISDPSDLLFRRDIQGLAGRLSDSDEEEWSSGAMRSVLSPLDVGVVEKCERILSSTHGEGHPSWSIAAASGLVDLRLELIRYMQL